MNNKDADRQISQMIEFIKQEAREKAEEIAVKTESEFNAKKLNSVVQARLEIKEEYAKKKKDAIAKRRIDRSRLITGARFTQMEDRDKILREMQQEVLARLAKASEHPQYKTLCKALIVQGLLVIMESEVEIRCRKEDLKIVDGVVKDALKEFKQLVKDKCGVDPPTEVKLNKNDFLAPGPSAGNSGMILSAH
eukprot:TRINITY_DN15652_c0_g1_i2.p2 TRINITY_DN15652_c0_g1~~TRINITY_DN15652_c0_g1_i2.p2  ORF type:complete len:193 (+),score=108.88 TRINITY_DN15652_c0_g1_i2:102-680(+)